MGKKSGKEKETGDMEQNFFSIGEVSKICNVSRKALRYYDQIGLISPDYINEENGYRYYSEDTLLYVPVLKYYKQMGFKLEEMQGLFDDVNFAGIRKWFPEKIGELTAEKRRLQESLISIQDWYQLIQEAQMVLRYQTCEISVKYFPEMDFCYMDQEFTYDYPPAVINIPWTNYLEEHGEEITGPVILHYDSFAEKMEGKCHRVRIMQQAVRPKPQSLIQRKRQRGMAVCVYHIGSHETIDQEYERIREWAKKRGCHLAKDSYERFVTDYWSTKKTEEFVTEIMLPFEQEAEE